VTALLRCSVLQTSLSRKQWTCVLQIMCGLVTTQYNVCDSSTALTATGYGTMLLSVLMSSVASVWNENQLKSLQLSMVGQNIILYSGGVVCNVAGHVVSSLKNPDTPAFFAGHSPGSLGVIAVNALNGIAIPAVYKYADSLLKSVASAVTTVLLTLLSWAFFNMTLNPVVMAGCVVIASSVFTYTLEPQSKQKTTAQKRYLAASFLCAMVSLSIVLLRL
jgi:drug/metabolite transporter (DMT)-like permease